MQAPLSQEEGYVGASSGGSGGGSGGGGGSSTPSKPAPAGQKHRHGIEFGEIVQVQPGEDIPVRDGLLCEFPADRYPIGGATIIEGVSRYGWRGIGSTELVAPKGQFQKAFVARHGCRNILVEGVTFQQRGDKQTGISVRAEADDGLELHDIEFAGYTPSAADNAAAGTYTFGPAVTASGGEGNLTGLRMLTGSDVVDYPQGTIAAFVGTNSTGTLHVSDAHIENSGSHAFYASKAASVHITDSVFKNNVNTNCRLSGDSSLTDSTIVVDAPVSRFTERDTGDTQRVRGVWWENQKHGASGGLIENVAIEFTSAIRSTGVIQVNGSVGGLTIRDTDIHNSTDAPNIVVEAIGSGARGKTPRTKWVRVENCSLSGGGRHPLVDDQRGNVEVR